MGGGGLVGVLLDLAEADVVNDEELGERPRLESPGIGAIAPAEGLEQVALSRSARCGKP
jgi:hypothetical protein